MVSLRPGNSPSSLDCSFPRRKIGPQLRRTSRVCLLLVLVLFVLVGLQASIHPLPPSASSSFSSSSQYSQPFSSNETTRSKLPIAGLRCPQVDASEMVYWSDLPSDGLFRSVYSKQQPQYLTFEADEGGFNNVRISLETVAVMALAMGRILVLPPPMRLYRLWDNKNKNANIVQLGDFYHLDRIVDEFPGLTVITFQDFLQREAMNGNMRYKSSNQQVAFPPHNRTDWSGRFHNYETTRVGESKVLWEWVRNATTTLNWDYGKCVAAFPSQPGPVAAERMQGYLQQVLARDLEAYPNAGSNARWKLRRDSYASRPTPVNASATDRLAELLAHRQQLCVYDETLQNTKFLHAYGEQKSSYRLLVHFYAFLFFEDHHQDLLMKRFVRDHFRYRDEIQCAAARVVARVRSQSRERGNVDGAFDSFHVRRTDFQYKRMLLSAEEIYESVKTVVPDGRTVFIATDETNQTFFELFRKHYKDVLFLSDFRDQLQGVNPNYYGMIDQLVASRGSVFVGVFYSTFTGYIHRLRGYHTQRDLSPGYEQGVIDSYYYAKNDQSHLRDTLRIYQAVEQPFWRQEFPVGWRLID